MNVLIRIVQVCLALIALNGVYGLAMQLTLAPFKRPPLWDIVGSVVIVLVLGFIIFLLQRYYAIRSKAQTRTSAGTFMGVALSGTSIAAFIGVAVVVILFIVAFLKL